MRLSTVDIARWRLATAWAGVGPERTGAVGAAAAVFGTCMPIEVRPAANQIDDLLGEIRTVDLADGSRVTLGTDSAVDVDLDQQHRQVRLLRGEAWLDVKSDPARPFLVETGPGSVRVTGTRFGVRMTDGPLAGLAARCVVVLDTDGTVLHSELVPEIAQEPDYDAALDAL